MIWEIFHIRIILFKIKEILDIALIKIPYIIK